MFNRAVAPSVFSWGGMLFAFFYGFINLKNSQRAFQFQRFLYSEFLFPDIVTIVYFISQEVADRQSVRCCIAIQFLVEIIYEFLSFRLGVEVQKTTPPRQVFECFPGCCVLWPLFFSKQYCLDGFSQFKACQKYNFSHSARMILSSVMYNLCSRSRTSSRGESLLLFSRLRSLIILFFCSLSLSQRHF